MDTHKALATQLGLSTQGSEPGTDATTFIQSDWIIRPMKAAQQSLSHKESSK
jgi:hypothetical protein